MRWFGALMIVAAAYFCGRHIASDEGRKLKTVESLIALLKYMRRRMVSERTPLYMLFASYEDDLLEETGFLNALRSSRTDLGSLWKKAVSFLPIDDGIGRELIHFGGELGVLPLDEQIKRLDSCLDALSNERANLAGSLPAKQKSIKTVCLLCGLLTAILLI